MKIAVIGGGPACTPELADGIGRLAGEIEVAELVLVDPDSARLGMVGPVAQRAAGRLLRSTVRYALGANPRGSSFVVGAGSTFVSWPSVEPADDYTAASLLAFAFAAQGGS